MQDKYNQFVAMMDEYKEDSEIINELGLSVLEFQEWHKKYIHDRYFVRGL